MGVLQISPHQSCFAVRLGLFSEAIVWVCSSADVARCTCSVGSKGCGNAVQKDSSFCVDLEGYIIGSPANLSSRSASVWVCSNAVAKSRTFFR